MPQIPWLFFVQDCQALLLGHSVGGDEVGVPRSTNCANVPYVIPKNVTHYSTTAGQMQEENEKIDDLIMPDWIFLPIGPVMWLLLRRIADIIKA